MPALSFLSLLHTPSQFAICAMKVKNRPMVNEVLGGEEALRKKLKQLEKENGELRNKLSSVRTTHTQHSGKNAFVFHYFDHSLSNSRSQH